MGADRISVSGWIVVRTQPGDESSALFPKWVSVRSRSVDFERSDRLRGDGSRSGSGRGVAGCRAIVPFDWGGRRWTAPAAEVPRTYRTGRISTASPVVFLRTIASCLPDR